MTGLAKLFKRRSFRPAAISASAFQRCAGGWTSQPALGVSYWLLAWLLVVCLQMLGIEPPVSQWMVGQRAPLSVVAAVDFLPPSAAGAAAEGEALAPLIAAGTHLVERGEILSADQLALLRVYEAQSSTLKALIQDGGNLAGQALLLALGVLISAALLRWLRREPRDHNKQILLFVVIGGLALVLTHWCLVLDRLGLLWPPAIVAGFLPLTLAPLLAAILIGPWHAIIMGFWVSFTAATFAGQDFAIFIIGLAMAVMIARLGRFVRTRTKVLRIGLAAGALGALFVLSFALAAQQPWSNMIPQVLAVLVGGLLSALAVLMILPLLEIIFGVTTDISLLELADMEHPLLKRLAIEAAGAYHHSLMVANLAQAAVATIGGN
ncbi:MAG: hypothetical protein GX806_01570 [Lentisphaerae bacterium]|nr:hypothetical protein [Lentisphaerota bacterium]